MAVEKKSGKGCDSQKPKGNGIIGHAGGSAAILVRGSVDHSKSGQKVNYGKEHATKKS